MREELETIFAIAIVGGRACTSAKIASAFSSFARGVWQKNTHIYPFIAF